MLPHFVVIFVIVLGCVVAVLTSLLVIGALLVARAQDWFEGSRSGRPVLERRTLETEIPPHSVPANAL
jgi:hypothetical protein